MSLAIPIIYTPSGSPPDLSIGWRILSGAIAMGCLSVLIVTTSLTPSPGGTSTHTALPGMQECQFLMRTGIPCPSCGMTTSFAWFVRGNLLASLWVQPMGTALACLTAVSFWAAMYISLTGKPALRLMRLIPTRYYLWPLLSLAVIGWGWKIFIHLRGIDGWR